MGRNNFPQELGGGKALEWVFEPGVVSILGGLAGIWYPPGCSHPIVDDETVGREENELGILMYGPTNEKERFRGNPAGACR